MTKSVEDKIKLAMAGLFNRAIFDATFLASMELVATDKVPTAATDCIKTVYYNPKFCEDKSPAHLMFVFAHEARHKALLHGFRRGNRDPLLANIAQDFVINRWLQEEKHDISYWQHTTVKELCVILAGGKAPPLTGGKKSAIPLDAGLSLDTSWETVYDLLDAARKQNKSGQQSGGQQNSGSGAGDEKDQEGDGEASPERGGSEPGSSRSPNTPNNGKYGDLTGDVDHSGFDAACKAEGMTEEQAEREMTAQSLQAAMSAKAVGQERGLAQRIIDQYGKPQVNWRSVLRKFVLGKYGPAGLAGDWSYRRPSRRFDATQIIMPSLVKTPNKPLVVVCDTSGSIGDKELAAFGAEINSIIRTVRPSVTHVLWVDTQVNEHQKFTPEDRIEFKPGGGGGTDLEVSWDYIEKEKIEPMCVVVISDLYTPFNKQPKFPVLWVSTTNVVAPYGETIRIEV